MFRRIYAIFVSRNREFLRDRSSLAWNLLLPVGLVFGLSFAFDGQRDEYTVGVLQAEAEIDTASHPFLETRYIRFVPYDDIDEALRKVERHQLDLLIDTGPPTREADRRLGLGGAGRKSSGLPGSEQKRAE